MGDTGTSQQRRQTAMQARADSRQALPRRLSHTGLVMFDVVFQDLRYALRTLSKSPTFAAVAILSLALGIGANTAIFSLIDALILQSLPVPHPEELAPGDDGQG